MKKIKLWFIQIPLIMTGFIIASIIKRQNPVTVVIAFAMLITAIQSGLYSVKNNHQTQYC